LFIGRHNGHSVCLGRSQYCISMNENERVRCSN
jgi:hypothetical protein